MSKIKIASKTAQSLRVSIDSDAFGEPGKIVHGALADTKHEGADAASGVNLSEGEVQAVKRNVRRAGQREDNLKSCCEAQNIAVRRCRRDKPVQAHGQDRRAQSPKDSSTVIKGDAACSESLDTAALLGERQARRRGNNTARAR